MPRWHTANDGIPTNAIGSLYFDPTDSKGKTIYVGTGEPNGSGDSEAGVGLYESTDGGQTFNLAFSVPSDPVNPTSSNGSDFFRGGVSNVQWDALSKRVSARRPTSVSASSIGPTTPTVPRVI